VCSCFTRPAVGDLVRRLSNPVLGPRVAFLKAVDPAANRQGVSQIRRIIKSALSGMQSFVGARSHPRCWTAGADLGERGSSRVVATASENILVHELGMEMKTNLSSILLATTATALFFTVPPSAMADVIVTYSLVSYTMAVPPIALLTDGSTITLSGTVTYDIRAGLGNLNRAISGVSA
jgi:hypothetical protein